MCVCVCVCVCVYSRMEELSEEERNSEIKDLELVCGYCFIQFSI